jgi:lipopolysaccharide heptosyltransferase II
MRQRFRLMVRSVNWLGDAVMMAPAVRAMRRGRPDLELTVVCQSKLAGFWRTVTGVDRVVELPADGGISAAARLIRAGNYDAAVVFPGSLRAGLEVWLAEVPVRVGYGGHSRSWALNLVCPPVATRNLAGTGAHQVHYYLNLAYFVGAPKLAEEDWVEPAVACESSRERGVRRVAVCPGAEYGPAKRWLPERFAEVIRTVSARRPVEWTLVGVTKDAPIGEEIGGYLKGTPEIPVHNCIGRTTLAELIGLLRGCDLLLTNDTGTMHLAASLGVRVVAVFGSTDPALTGPLGEGHRILSHAVPCGPCFQRECQLDFACMRGVGAQRAAEAVEAILLSGEPGEKGSPAIPV